MKVLQHEGKASSHVVMKLQHAAVELRRVVMLLRQMLKLWQNAMMMLQHGVMARVASWCHFFATLVGCTVAQRCSGKLR